MLKSNTTLIFFLLFLTLSLNQLAHAKVMYVSDELTIHMRTDKGVAFRIRKSITSGAKLRVLAVDKSGYTHVETEGGTRGWVLSRFLIKNPIAKDKLKKAQDAVAKFNEQKKQLKKELSELKKQKSHLDQSTQDLLKRNAIISTELTKLRKIAARPMQLEKNNEKLRNELLSNESQSRLLKQELQTLKDDSEKQWFITGAAILFGGILLGLILPNLKSNPQRKQNWNRL
ncbi:MAG: TIGR04211 family SH3 domain-containing protein [Pseudomonadota bacterium]